ncbi:MAG TPA: hypothetical protein PKK61_03000 [Defluviitaleaceae bacterium]|nr:hypothetical protein [Defluviitaleaceae bacterium]
MSEEKFREFDRLVGVLKELRPEIIYIVRNGERYKEVEKSIRTLAKMAEESNPGGVKFNIPVIDGQPLDDEKMACPLTGTFAGFEIYCDTTIIFDDMKKFMNAMKAVDVFEVYSKNDGSFVMSFGYEDAYKSRA